jgi:hypothetical protein
VSIVFPDLGEVYLLRRLVAPDPIEDIRPWHLRLYKNNYTPNRVSLIGAFTECDFDGYAAKDMTLADWQAIQLADGIAIAQWGAGFSSWIADSGSQNVYGYYVTDPDDTLCILAERFDAPFPVDSGHPCQFIFSIKSHGEYQPDP